MTESEGGVLHGSGGTLLSQAVMADVDARGTPSENEQK
jgi:hypothetical protein